MLLFIGIALLLISTVIKTYAMVDFSQEITKTGVKKSFYIYCFLSIYLWNFTELFLSYFIDNEIFLITFSSILFYISPLFLYKAMEKYYEIKKELLLFVALIIYLTLKTAVDFASVLISSFVGDHLFDFLYPIFAVVLSILGLLFCKQINKIWKFNFNYFIDKQDEFESLIRQVVIAMVLLHTVFVVSFILGETERYDSFGSILVTLCFTAFFVLMFYLRAKREDYEKEEELERKKRNQENLQSYTEKIVSLYNEVRSFRHDFAGMVSSLKISIDSGNLEEIKQIHREVLETANSHLGAEKFTIFELNNVGDSAFRSVLMDKAIKAEKYGVHLTLEIKDCIGKLPVPMLDLVRMTNIIFDNAIEGAYESHSKEVVLSVIELADSYVIVAKNSRKRQNLKLEKVYEMGYSTKGKHRGLGLPTVKHIVDSYDNITLDTEIGRDFFTQVFHIEKERMF